MIALVEYGFYLFVFLLPWQTRLIWQAGILNDGFWEYGTLSLYGTELLLWALLLAFFYIVLRRGGEGRRVTWSSIKQPSVGVYWLLVSFVMLSAASIFWALDSQLALFSWFHIVEAAALMAFVLHMSFSYVRLAVSWVLAGVLQAVFAIGQFLIQSTPANKWLGLALHDATIGGSIVLETWSERWLRAYGSLPHPNILAGFLTIALLFVFYLAFTQAVTRWQRVGLMFASALISLGIFLSFSRSAWVALITCLPLLGFWLYKNKAKAWQRIFSKLLIVMVVTVIIFAATLHSAVYARLAGEQRLEIDSLRLRVTFTEQAFEVLREHGLQGVGIGNYTLGVHTYVNSTWPFWYYQPVHNIYLLALVETGALGLIILVAAIGWLGYALLRRTHTLLSALVALMGVAILIVGLVDHYFWTLYVGIVMAWIVIGLNIRLLRSGG